MGYMTVVSILNDGWDQIKKYPEKFVENIDEGMLGIDRFNFKGDKAINSYGVGNHANLMDVAKSHHADDPRMYIAFQNSLDIIGWGNDNTNLDYRKRMLRIAKEMIDREEEVIKRLEEDRVK